MAVLTGNIVRCPLCGSRIMFDVGWTRFTDSPACSFSVDLRDAWTELRCSDIECGFSMHFMSRDELAEMVRIKLLLHKKFGRIS